MHGDGDDGHPQEEVGGQGVAEEGVGQQGGEDGGERTAVLLQDCVCKLEEEAGQDTLQCVCNVTGGSEWGVRAGGLAWGVGGW